MSVFPSNSLLIKSRADAGSVAAQRSLLADRVGTLEDPVLPGAQAPEDLALEGFRSGESQVRLHPGQGVGGKAHPLLERDADLVVPVDVVEHDGDQTGLVGGLGVEVLAFCPNLCDSRE